MSSQLNRRDFLKLMAMLPLMQVSWPNAIRELGSPLYDPQAPNVLILVFDALSAHHLNLNGYQRSTTPNLSRFAERATVFHSHYAGGNFTTAGTSSLLTGVYPWSHRAFHLHGLVSEDFKSKNIFSALEPKGYYNASYSHNLLVTSLLDQFRQAIEGFTWTRELCLYDDQYADRFFPKDYTPAFYADWNLFHGAETNPSSLFLSLVHRFLRFSHKRESTKRYGKLFPRGVPNLYNYFFIPDQATDWIMEQLKSLPRPFLTYYHLLPPHEPYTTRQDFIDVFKDGWSPDSKPASFFTEGHSDEILSEQRRTYDEYLAYADEEFGRILDFMEQNAVLDNTYVIFTSDHGELFERGIRGHITPALYEPVIRVPLLISKPGQQRREDVYTPTSCVDILPTLVHITGQEIPEWCEGQVLPTFGAKEPGNDRPVFAVEAKSNPKQAPLKKATISMVVDQYKLIHYGGYSGHKDVYELYDLHADPDERTDLYNLKQSLAADLRGMMMEKLAQVDQPYQR